MLTGLYQHQVLDVGYCTKDGVSFEPVTIQVDGCGGDTHAIAGVFCSLALERHNRLGERHNPHGGKVPRRQPIQNNCRCLLHAVKVAKNIDIIFLMGRLVRRLSTN